MSHPESSMKTKTILAVTTSRADYGICRPVLRRIEADPTLRLRIAAGGFHLSVEAGHTIDEIERDGFTIHERPDFVSAESSRLGTAISMGRGVEAFARCFERIKPDIVLVLGDRFEMYAAVVAALPLVLPVAHIHGGEVTTGAFDDALRHSITKLSHLHFTATRAYADRVIQLGEEPWRVTVSGAPALDNLANLSPLPREALEERIGLDLGTPPVLVTFHPTTLEPGEAERQVDCVLEALASFDVPLVFTAPNADPEGNFIRRRIRAFVDRHSRAVFRESLGSEVYFSMMTLAGAMVGNSSSGLIEAPSFRLPTVNIGNRQEGRIRGANVIDTGYRVDDIKGALATALSEPFRKSLQGIKNPYYQGGAADIIARRLKDVELGPALTRKIFHDLPRETFEAGQ